MSDIRNDPYASYGGREAFFENKRRVDREERAKDVAAWNRFVGIMSGTGIVSTIPPHQKDNTNDQ